MKRITLQLRTDQHERLKELTRPGVSMSHLVRQALDEYLSKPKKPAIPHFYIDPFENK